MVSYLATNIRQLILFGEASIDVIGSFEVQKSICSVIVERVLGFMETHRNNDADERSRGSFSSEDIDIDVDAVLAQSNPNISNVSESQHMLSPNRHDSKTVEEQQTEHPTPDVHLPLPDDSHSVDQIVQIDIVGGSHVRIYHGAVGVGRIQAVNDVHFDSKQPISMLDMLQLLALQPLHSLDVQPVSEISAESGIQERVALQGKELQIRFVFVPEGSLGLELAHTSLAQALGIPLSSSQTLGCGFRIEAQLPHHPPSSSGLSVGDVVVAVNDASIVLLSAPTAAAMLAQKKTRKFTVVRIVKTSPETGESPDRSDAQIYLQQRSNSPAGRQRLRRFIREEIERKYAPDDAQGIESLADDSSDGHREARDISHHFPSGAAKRRWRPSPANDEASNQQLPPPQQSSQFINDDDNDDDNDGYQEPLHKRWCEVRRTFLCHTMFKPVPDRAAASRDPFAALADPSLRRFDDSETNWAQQYSDVLYRQRFLEVIHANDGSQALKRSLLRRFQSKANT